MRAGVGGDGPACGGPGPASRREINLAFPMFGGADAVDFPDVPALFRLYNVAYFESLLGDVVLEWSSRLTVAAGVCVYKGTRRYETAPITIRLSSRLLQFRGPRDIASVLLHEMIHAYLFRLKVFERDPHGPVWRSMAARINALERENGVVVSPYHNFTEEVAYVREQREKRSLELKRKALEREERRRLSFSGKPGVLRPVCVSAGKGLAGGLGVGKRGISGRGLVGPARAAGAASSRAGGPLVQIGGFAFPGVPAGFYRIGNFQQVIRQLGEIWARVRGDGAGPRAGDPGGSRASPVSADIGAEPASDGAPPPLPHRIPGDDVPETLIVDGGSSCVSITDLDDSNGVIELEDSGDSRGLPVVDLTGSVSGLCARS